MTFQGIKATAATAAVLIAASIGGQAFAQSYDHGQTAQGGYQQGPGNGQGDYGRGDRGPGGYDRDFGDHNFNDRDFDQRGRFYYNGDLRQRTERIEQWARFSVRSGRLNQWQGQRVFRMLDEVKREAHFTRRDGVVTPREQMMLNSRLDDAVRYLRGHMNRGQWNGDRR